MPKTFTSSVYIIWGEKVLLHKHKKHNMILPIGGYVEKDESPQECAIREVFEETRLEVELIVPHYNIRYENERVTFLIPPVFVLSERLGNDENIDFIFFAKVKEKNNQVLPENCFWCKREDLSTLDLHYDVFSMALYAFNSTDHYL